MVVDGLVEKEGSCGGDDDDGGTVVICSLSYNPWALLLLKVPMLWVVIPLG